MEQKTTKELLEEKGFFFDTETQEYVFVAPNTHIRYHEKNKTVLARLSTTEYSVETKMTNHPAFDRAVKERGIVGALSECIESIGGKPI
jgi:hypothetical protein